MCPQIRSAFEAGLIEPTDTDFIRRAFLDGLKSLNPSDPFLSLPDLSPVRTGAIAHQ